MRRHPVASADCLPAAGQASVTTSSVPDTVQRPKAARWESVTHPTAMSHPRIEQLRIMAFMARTVDSRAGGRTRPAAFRSTPPRPYNWLVTPVNSEGRFGVSQGAKWVLVGPVGAKPKLGCTRAVTRLAAL